MKRILIYSLVSLGDVIMATSTIPIWRAAWPGVKISMLAKGMNAAVIEDNPNIDDPIIYTYKSKKLGLGLLWGMLKQLRNRRFDLSVSLDRHKRGAWMNWMVGIPKRVGPGHIFDSSPSWATRFYTNTIEPSLDVDLDSRVTIMQDLARQYTGLSVVGRPSFGRPSEKERRKASELLSGLPKGRYKIGLCLQGNLPIRSWPPERFATLIDHLWEKENAAAYIIGTAAQSELAAKVNSLCRHKAADFCGLTNLKELTALLMGSNAFVGLDTGSSHLAAAVNAPIVTLFGSSTPRRFKAMSGTEEGENWNLALWSGRDCSPCNYWNPDECPHGLACMHDLSVNDVAAEIRKLCKNYRPEPLV